MAEQRPDDTMATNASVSDTEGDHSDDSQGSRNPKKRKRNQKISCELCKARKVRQNNRVCVYQERKKPGMRIAYVHELEDKVNRLEAVLHSLGRRVEEHIQEHSSPAQSKISVPYSQPGYTPHSDLSRDAISHNTASPNTDSSWQYVVHRDAPRQLPEPMSVQSVVDTPEARASNRPRSYTASTLTNNNPFSLGESDLPPYDLVYNLVDLFFKHINPWSPILDRKTTFNVLFGGSRLTSDDRVLLNAIVATTLRFSSDQRLTPASRKQYHDTAKTKVLFHSLSHPSIGSMQALIILAIDTIGTSASLQGMNLLAFVSRSITQLNLTVEKTTYLGPPPPSPHSNHHLSHPTQPPSWIEEEGRRRLVWMLYILDRYTSIASTSTFTLPDSALHLRLPSTYDLFSRNAPVSTRWPRTPSTASQPNANSPANLGSFSYHCEVLTILSRIHDFLSQPIPIPFSHPSTTAPHNSYATSFFSPTWLHTYTSLDHELTTWLHSLPGEYSKISQLCHSDPGSKISNWIMLHAAFVLAVIRLHSVAAYPSSVAEAAAAGEAEGGFSEGPGAERQRQHGNGGGGRGGGGGGASQRWDWTRRNAMQRCLGAVESLRGIAQDVIGGGMLGLLGMPFAFSLWTCARVLVVHAAVLEEEGDAEAGGGGGMGVVGDGDLWEKVEFFVQTLEEMGTYWEIARTYARTLQWVVGEGRGARVERKEGRGSGGGGGRRTFREMRRRSCEINRLLNERREGGWWEQSRVLTPVEGEVEALDVFGFFDYPRVAPEDGREGQRQQTMGFDPLQQSQHGDLQHRSEGRGSRDGTSTPGAGSMPPLPPPHGMQQQNQSSGPLPPLATLTGGSGLSSGAVSSTMQSPVYAMPNREGDWMSFQPPHE